MHQLDSAVCYTVYDLNDSHKLIHYYYSNNFIKKYIMYPIHTHSANSIIGYTISILILNHSACKNHLINRNSALKYIIPNLKYQSICEQICKLSVIPPLISNLLIF